MLFFFFIEVKCIYLVSVGSILTLSKSSYLTLLVSRDSMACLTGGKVTNCELKYILFIN